MKMAPGTMPRKGQWRNLTNEHKTPSNCKGWSNDLGDRATKEEIWNFLKRETTQKIEAKSRL